MTRLLKSMAVAFALLLATGARAGIVLTSLPGQLSQNRQLGAATSVGTQALFAGGLKSAWFGAHFARRHPDGSALKPVWPLF